MRSTLLRKWSDPNRHLRGLVTILTTLFANPTSLGSFPKLPAAVMHVGEQDWQSVPSAVLRFGQLAGIPVHVVSGRGHMLGADVVGPILDNWL